MTIVFEEIPYGLEVDDAEYYYSAVTIGLDFDLDFSNQMEGVENRYLNQEEKKSSTFSSNWFGDSSVTFCLYWK